jgi:effector-binding domain-containing protein
MKALKIIGVIFLILIVLFFIGAALIPKEFKVESSNTINKPPSLIFKQVNDFRNWSPWSPWEIADPEMKSTYGGPDLGTGAWHSWLSESMGNGKQTITKSVPYELIETELDFYEQGKGTSYFKFIESNGSTQVTWGMVTETSYPFDRVLFFFLKGMMNDMFDEGLANLKEVCEAKSDPPVLEETTLPEMLAISILDSCHWNKVGPKKDEMHMALLETIRNKGLAMTGMAFTKYILWDEERQFTAFETAIPVNKEVNVRGNIEIKTFPKEKAVKGTHYGAYDKTTYLYMALDEYLLEHGMEMASGPVEIYITDPSSEPDTSKWQTDIYFPYK